MRRSVASPSICLVLPTGLGLSAVRLFDHIEYGQVLPFNPPASEGPIWERPEAFVDVIFLAEPKSSPLNLNGVHAGCTLWDALQDTRLMDKWKVPSDWGESLKRGEVQRFLWQVSLYLEDLARRQAVRSVGIQFDVPIITLYSEPVAWTQNGPRTVFAGLNSRLEKWLRSQTTVSRKPREWRDALTQNRFDAEEVRCSGLGKALDEAVSARCKDDWLGTHLLSCINFSESRIAVLPVTSADGPQLKLEPATFETKSILTKRHKRALKPDANTRVVKRSRSLGLRLERVESPALWGTDVMWQAVNHRGEVLADVNADSVFDNAESAEALLGDVARQSFPQFVSSGLWQHIGWSAGEHYREWLITLPWHPLSFHSQHFPHRNVLAHVRCDIREDEDGHRFLLIQEIQSDWSRQAQRHRKACHSAVATAEKQYLPTAPFIKRWASLTFKLMVLHAVAQGLSGVAWTTGQQQAARHGCDYLLDLCKLYDDELPIIARSIFPSTHEPVGRIELFIPQDFAVYATPEGHLVYDDEGNFRGIYETAQAAWKAVPDGAREQLTVFHGLVLDASMRSQTCHEGFDVWDAP